MASDEAAETLAGVGEFAVIDRLVADRDQPAAVALGPGDDAAVVFARRRQGRWCPPTCSPKAGTSGWTGPRHTTSAVRRSRRTPPTSRRWARRATAFVVAFGAPGDTPAAQALELADGMWHEARLLGAGIVGGDLVSAPQWVISVTVLGDLDGREPVLRSGARPGDTLAVTGDLGRSAAGYALWHSDVRQFAELRRRHLVPEPPYGQGRVAADAGATAMTDVSDGLLADLGHIAQASGVGVDVSPPPWWQTGTQSPALPARWAPTRWNGCSAVAKTMHWWRRFPVRRRRAGG